MMPEETGWDSEPRRTGHNNRYLPHCNKQQGGGENSQMDSFVCTLTVMTAIALFAGTW